MEVWKLAQASWEVGVIIFRKKQKGQVNNKLRLMETDIPASRQQTEIK